MEDRFGIYAFSRMEECSKSGAPGISYWPMLHNLDEEETKCKVPLLTFDTEMSADMLQRGYLDFRTVYIQIKRVGEKLAIEFNLGK